MMKAKQFKAIWNRANQTERVVIGTGMAVATVVAVGSGVAIGKAVGGGIIVKTVVGYCAGNVLGAIAGTAAAIGTDVAIRKFQGMKPRLGLK